MKGVDTIYTIDYANSKEHRTFPILGFCLSILQECSERGGNAI